MNSPTLDTAEFSLEIEELEDRTAPTADRSSWIIPPITGIYFVF